MISEVPGCRSCGARPLRTFLDLGRTPLANALLPAEAASGPPEPTYPLQVARCPGCSLVQLTHTVAPEALFRDYPYFSSYSDTMLAHADALAARLVGERRLGARSRVVEVASNDGYLLRSYARRGIPVLGIEPARNVARVAREQHGIATLEEFFDEPLARRVAATGKADVLHAHNVMAHVPDLNGFLAGVSAVLADDGVAVIEVPYVRDLIEKCEFDTIYHEHVFYFSWTALKAAVVRHGLVAAGVERVPIHGGSLRVLLSKGGRDAPAADRLLEEERALGMDRDEGYRDFAERVLRLKASARALFGDLKRRGERLAAYGASAKGTTLLNTFGLGRETFDFAVDRSPHKQGKLLPGSRLPVLPPEALLERMPSHVLLLVWNFADEILRQQEEYTRRGGRFVVPVPEMRVVS